MLPLSLFIVSETKDPLKRGPFRPLILSEAKDPLKRSPWVYVISSGAEGAVEKSLLQWRSLDTRLRAARDDNENALE